MFSKSRKNYAYTFFPLITQKFKTCPKQYKAAYLHFYNIPAHYSNSILGFPRRIKCGYQLVLNTAPTSTSNPPSSFIKPVASSITVEPSSIVTDPDVIFWVTLLPARMLSP